MAKRKRHRDIEKQSLRADPRERTANSEIAQSRPAISHGKKGNGIPKSKHIVLFAVAAIIIVVLYSLILNLPNSFVFNSAIEEEPQTLPELPDLSLKNQTLKQELFRMNKLASILPLNAAKVGRLGEIYYANLFFEEAEICYNIAKQLDKKNPRWPYFLAQIYQKMGTHKDVSHLIEQTVDISPGYYPAILKLADIHFKVGELGRAEEGYKQLISQESVGPYAYLGLGRICIANEEWESAEEYLEKAIAMDRDFGAAHRVLANVYRHLGRIEEMRESQSIATGYRFAEAPDPWMDDLVFLCYDQRELLRQIDIAFKTQNMARASTITERAVSLFPDNIDIYLEIGTNFQQHKTGLPAALALFEKALELEPENLEALAKAAKCMLLLNRPDEEEKYYQQILQINPSNDSALGNLGYVMYQKGRNNEALKLLKESIAHNPQNTESLYNLGLLMMRLNKMEEAINFFKEVRSIDPDFPDAHYSLGFSLLQLARINANSQQSKMRVSTALALFKKALKLEPENLGALVRASECLILLKRPDEAERYCQQILQLDPSNDGALGNLGYIMYQNGKYNEALNLQRESIAHNPQNTESLYNLGLLMMRLNKMGEAIDSFNKVLSIDPNFRNAHYNLGFSLLRSGKMNEAVVHLKNEITNNPNMMMAHGKLGQVYEYLGRMDEALACYREVISIRPDDAMGNFFLGRLLMKKGKQREAVTQLRKALVFSQKSGNSVVENQIKGILRKLNPSVSAAP